MPDTKRIVFLYTELANYFLVCVKQLQQDTHAQIHIIHWPLNPEAPFQFDMNIPGVTFYNRKNYAPHDLLNLVRSIEPQLIYCSGWIDKDYTAVCRQFKNNVPVVGGIDTAWNGNLKQYLRVLTSRITVRKFFSHVWIAGEPQRKYAVKLGFSSNKILTGVYSADVPAFNALYHKYKDEKFKNSPKRFIFVGRYLEFKGIYDLWKAFVQSVEKHHHDWELVCLGTGAEWEKRVIHPQIKHIGFVQPADMEKWISQTSVFVLPSRFEPWAVALHEFAAAGFPLICSDKVGAATAFLRDGENGFTFPAGQVKQLEQCFVRFIQMDQKTLNAFAEKSNRMAQNITPATWSSTFSALL